MKSHCTIFIDEAGRGPIAGPVVVGLVVGMSETDRSAYRDSKSLTPAQREELYSQITSDPSILRASGSASAKEIDHNGIIRALRRATIRGLYKLIKKIPSCQGRFDGGLGKQYYRKTLLETLGTLQTLGTCKLIIDGNHTFGLDHELNIPVQTIIKGDRDVPAISAASIIAKVTRDREMVRLSSNYPGYGFDGHKGYGTTKHYAAIDELGLCDLHRKKWIK